nr:reverse transcriptase domain-containing protein [Tanacetum cinerariifolium]
KASKPKTLDETIELSNDLMDQKLRTYVERQATRHFKRDCPKLKNKDEEKVNAPGWVYAVGNVKKRGNASRDPDSNFVTGCQIFLAQISVKKKEDKSEGKQLEDVPVVRDYHEVFPKDLSALPPVRPVEFQIDSIPGAAP